MKLIALAIFASLFSAGFFKRLMHRSWSIPTKSHLNFVKPQQNGVRNRSKIMDCNKKAEEAKVLPRDRASHVQHCLDGQ